ncbi:MAG: porin [Chloroflexi bacterium]|nr:porin [Chloroflexota bacterium]
MSCRVARGIAGGWAWVVFLPLSLAVAKGASPEKKDKDDDVDISLYGRFWPRLTFRDGSQSSTDITDALSRVGIAAKSEVTDSVTALLTGEWDVDIEANGDFGDARQAFAGLQSTDYGLVAIGKQWDPHYNVVAQVTDVYYHRSSPFGYDYEGPYRTNNLVRYAHSFKGFKVDASVQVNGELQDGAGQDRIFRTNAGVSTAPDHVDAASVGIGHRYGPVYLGVSYLRQSGAIARDEELRRNIFGVGGSWDVTEDLYLAFTYQKIDHDFVKQDERSLVDNRAPYTFDILASCSLGRGYRVIAGLFAYDDDRDGFASDRVLGSNLTLTKELNSSMDVFVEWLQRDFRKRENVSTFSLGFRFDFDAAIF